MKIIKNLSLFAATSLMLLTSLSASATEIHRTYISIDGNQTVWLAGVSRYGKKELGVCQYSRDFLLKNSEFYDGEPLTLDGDKLLALIGPGYDCVKDIYQGPGDKAISDTYELIWDGSNYVSTTPNTSTVTIQ